MPPTPANSQNIVLAVRSTIGSEQERAAPPAPTASAVRPRKK